MNIKKRLVIERLDRETMIYSLTLELDWPVKKAARMTKEQADLLTDKELYVAFKRLEYEENKSAIGSATDEQKGFRGEVAELASTVTATIWVVCGLYFFITHSTTHIWSLYALWFLVTGLNRLYQVQSSLVG